MPSASASSAANARASFTTSSIEIPDRGTNGITSAAPIRGWPPVCFVMSISSTALAAPASALARTAYGEPTTVVLAVGLPVDEPSVSGGEGVTDRFDHVEPATLAEVRDADDEGSGLGHRG